MTTHQAGGASAAEPPAGAGVRRSPRVRGESGLLASAIVAVAVFCSAQPLRALFEGTGWLLQLGALLAVCAMAGALARTRLSVGRALLAQGVVFVATLLLFFGGGTLLFGLLPTPATLAHWNELLMEAGAMVREHAAPVPENAGVSFLLVSSLGALGLAADALGVTLRYPALAGLPILAPFLTAVANGDGGLHPRYFLVTAVGWLVLMAVHDRRAALAWSGRARVGSSRATDGSRQRGRAAATGIIAAAALTLSLVAAAALPHLPVRYLADGLGTGGLGGGSQIGFSPSANMLQDLTSTTGRPVLRYETDDPAPPPLRAATSTRYVAGEWLPDEDTGVPSDTPQLRYPMGWAQREEPAPRHRIDVSDNRLAAPYLAAPADVIEGRVYEARWAQGRSGVLSVDTTPPRYTLSYLVQNPDGADLRAARGGAGAYSRSVRSALDPAGITPLVEQRAQEATELVRGNPYDEAVAIQDWLRTSGGFRYSLELAPMPGGVPQPAEASERAINHFLETKQGYCVQFTTAMVLMARSLGIPARVATGFLPGTSVAGVREVVPADAHAWPELYFHGTGWLRFEPTPGSRSGVPPSYSVAPSQPESPATPTATPTAGATATAEPTGAAPQRPEEVEAGAAAPQPSATAQDRGLPFVALLVALLLLAAVVPTAGWVARRRLAGAGSDREDPADRIEAGWSDLVVRLEDLGVDVDPAAVLPQQRDRIRTAGDLRGEDDEALTRLARLVESARYAPPGAGSDGEAEGALAD
ncbi:hypothetical protein KILIM_034_00600, partial [Kineosphaera limosa NBRC 100340]